MILFQGFAGFFVKYFIKFAKRRPSDLFKYFTFGLLKLDQVDYRTCRDTNIKIHLSIQQQSHSIVGLVLVVMIYN